MVSFLSVQTLVIGGECEDGCDTHTQSAQRARPVLIHALRKIFFSLTHSLICSHLLQPSNFFFSSRSFKCGPKKKKKKEKMRRDKDAQTENSGREKKTTSCH